MPSSYTTDLPNDILLDTGVLYYDPVTPGTMVKFGGTRGGLTFNRNRDVRAIPFDGASGETAGLHRYIDGVPTIEGTVIVIDDTKAAILEPGSTTSDSGVDPSVIRTITPLPYRTMLDSATDYHKWHVIWKRGNGGTFKVVFPVGLAVINTIGAQDNNEGEMPIVIRAVNDPADIASTDEVPAPYYYEITGPDIVETP